MKATQKYSSADTSLNQIPALHRAYARRVAKGDQFIPDAIIDFGAGRYDAAGEYLTDMLPGVKYFPQDRYNRTEAENERARCAAEVLQADGICANVLNVIAEPEARAELLAMMAAMVRGVCVVGVYEGDGTGEGRRTTKGWQNNRKLATYEPEVREHFANVVRKGGMLVCWN